MDKTIPFSSSNIVEMGAHAKEQEIIFVNNTVYAIQLHNEYIVIWARKNNHSAPWYNFFDLWKKDSPELFDILTHRTQLTKPVKLELLLIDRSILPVIEKYLRN